MKLWRSSWFTPTMHVLIWALLLSIPSIVFKAKEFFGLSHAYFLVSSVFHIGIFYLNSYLLYPRLITRRRWWLYIPALIVIVQGSFYFKLFLLKLDPQFVLTDDNRRIIFFGIMPFIIASIIFRLISDRINLERSRKEARAEQLTSELKYLRSQVSPHFLFNTMTNLVSLARQQSPLLETSLIKLSELLRYMLYDTSREKITIDDEIEQVKNYLSLQQLRFGEGVDIRLDIKNNAGGSFIEPMLLIPFIENAFKHGIGMVQRPFIYIEIEIVEQKLFFMVSNNYNAENRSKDENSGIGLANVRNRLELLYPAKYQLLVTGENNVFKAQLNLDLHDEMYSR